MNRFQGSACKIILSLLGVFSSIPTTAQRDTLIVAYTEAAPFIIDDNGQTSGISIKLWQDIAKDLELSYVLQKMEFKAMLAALEKGDIDVSINPLTVTADRSAVMNFTQPYYISNATIAVSEFSAFLRFKNFLANLLSSNLINGLALLLIFIMFFGMAAWYFERRKNPEQFRKGFKGLWDGIWWSVVTMTTVGYGDKSPKSRGGKMIALLWMFSALLFVSSLTASIASSLTVTKINSSHSDFQNFKNKKVGTIANTSTSRYLKTHFFEQVYNYPHVIDGLSALQNHEIEAFIYDEPILKYKMSSNPDFYSMKVLPIKFDLQMYAFGINPELENLRKQLSIQILKHTTKDDFLYLLQEFNLAFH